MAAMVLVMLLLMMAGPHHDYGYMGRYDAIPPQVGTLQVDRTLGPGEYNP